MRFASRLLVTVLGAAAAVSVIVPVASAASSKAATSKAAGSNSSKATVPAAAPAPRGDTTAPTMPHFIAGSSSADTTAHIDFGRSSDNVGVTAYLLTRSSGNYSIVVAQFGQLAHAFDDTGLRPGTAYTYSVRATDRAGNLSEPISVTVTTRGTAPVDTVPMGGFASSMVFMDHVAFTVMGGRDDIGIVSYRVSIDGVEKETIPATFLMTNYASPRIEDGKTHVYSFVAVDSIGQAGRPVSTRVEALRPYVSPFQWATTVAAQPATR